jgi:type IV pilus assembly protein PilV
MSSLTRTSTRLVKQNCGQTGFALIEALIAILIFSLGILGLIGLQAISTQSTTMSKARMDASIIASQRIAEVWDDVANIATMPPSATDDVSAWLPQGQRTTTIAGDNVTVTVTWKMPSEATAQSYTAVAVVVGK